jgi:hypothetical protein
MSVNGVDRSRAQAPALALYVMAGFAAVLVAAVTLQFGGIGITLIPCGWLILSPLARLARRRGGA